MRVAVVGSGFGGLGAAVRLAAAGHSVDVFEKRDRIGGRAYQYEIDGYRFDGGPTVLTAPFMFEELFALAGERLADHVDLIPLDPFYRVFDADRRPFDYWAGLDDFLAEVKRRSPTDVEGVRSLNQRISRIFDAFYPYTERPMMDPQVMLAMMPFMVQQRAMLGVSSTVNRFVKDPFLRQALSFHPLLVGGRPSTTPALYSLIVEFERRWGVHYARGGTGALVAAIGGLLERLGGRIHLQAEVAQITVEGGRATGVRLADGTEHRADVVVSNGDPGHTYGDLLHDTRRTWNSDTRARLQRPSMSLHVLYLGADRQWPDSPLTHHNILLPRDNRATMKRVFGRRRPARVDAARDPFLYVHVPSKTDASIAPPGHENMYVLVAVPPLDRDGYEDSGAAVEEALAVRETVLDTLEDGYLPGLRDHLVVEHAIGPEHFRDVLNTPRGAAFSLRPTLMQSGWFRPHNRSQDVRGLFIVGAGTHPGAGVPAVLASGKIAAMLIDSSLATRARVPFAP
jgi:phytoene desaturase